MNRANCSLVGFLLLTGCLGLVALRAQEAKKEEAKKETPRAANENPERDRPAQSLEEERRNLDRKVAEVKRRIVELRAANKPDDAAELERDLKAMVEKMSRETRQSLQDNLRRHIEELRKPGRLDEADQLELRVREGAERAEKARLAQPRREGQQADRPHPEFGAPEEVQRRLHHLHVAIENLRAAGLHEPAEQLQRQAEMIRHQAGGPPDVRAELEEVRAIIRQQNERIERLEHIAASSRPSGAPQAATSALPAADVKIDERMLAFVLDRIKRYDKNQDGVLTKDEWSSMTKDMSPADRDGDGKITPTEYAIFQYMGK